MATLAEAVVVIRGDTTKFTKDLKDTRNKLKASVREFSEQASIIGRQMAVIGAAITAGFGLAVRTTGQFQQAMVNSQAVIGATAEELKQLTDFAREMGKTTVFSARQAADAMFFLGSAGFKTDQIMSSLQGTLKLAAATNSDLAFTSETVVATLSAYQLAAEDADRVSNVFAATISASQATMERLSTALSFVAPVAQSVGIELEQTTAILGKLFDAGIGASTAGTALRMAINSLLNPSDEAADILDRLGVVVTNTDGSLRDFTDIVGDLADVGLSAADALTIFGNRAGPSMLALVGQGADAVRDLTEAVTGTNKAAEIAEKQTSTFQGRLKLLRSAFEELQITIGNQLLPTLTTYVEKLTEAINKTTEWTDKHPRLTKQLVAFGAALGVMVVVGGALTLFVGGITKAGLAVTTLAGVIPKAVFQVQLLGSHIAGLTSTTVGLLSASALGGIIAGLITFAASLKLAKNAVDDTREELIGFDSVTKAQRENIKGIKEAIDSYTQAIKELEEAQDKGVQVASLLGTSLKQANGEVRGFTKEVGPIPEQIERLEKRIRELNTQLRITSGDIFLTGSGAKEFGSEATILTGIMDRLFNPMQAIADLFNRLAGRDIANAKVELQEFTIGMTNFLASIGRAITFEPSEAFQTEEARKEQEEAANRFTAFIQKAKSESNELARVLEANAKEQAKLLAPISIESAMAIIEGLQEGYTRDSLAFQELQEFKAGIFSDFTRQVKEEDEKAEKERKKRLDKRLKEIDKELKKDLEATGEFNERTEELRQEDIDNARAAAEEEADIKRKQAVELFTLQEKLAAAKKRLDKREAKRLEREAKQAAQEWEKATRDIRNAFEDLFSDLLSGDKKNAFEQFFDALKSIAIKKFSEIAAAQALSGLGLAKGFGLGKVAGAGAGIGSALTGVNIGAAAGGIGATLGGIGTGIAALIPGGTAAVGLAAATPILGPLALAAGIGFLGKELFGFADGGVVQQPTIAAIGERGPEAVIPLRGGKIPIEGGAGFTIQNLNIVVNETDLENIDPNKLDKILVQQIVPGLRRVLSDTGTSLPIGA